MENFKGTKGKWWTEESFDEKYNQAVVNINSGEHVESFITIWSGQGILSDTDKANDKLIAHAPEMLEMLKNCLSFVEVLKDHGITDWSDERNLRELINKAITI